MKKTLMLILAIAVLFSAFLGITTRTAAAQSIGETQYGGKLRSLTDLNGDGRPEIVGFGEAGVYVARNNGDGTFQPAQIVNTYFRTLL